MLASNVGCSSSFLTATLWYFFLDIQANNKYILLVYRTIIKYIQISLGGNSNARGFSKTASIRPPGNLLFLNGGLCFVPLKKAKPIVRQGRISFKKCVERDNGNQKRL
jgi:hypothetical protein